MLSVVGSCGNVGVCALAVVKRLLVSDEKCVQVRDWRLLDGSSTAV
jgi:hypothetical protein